MPRAAAAQQLLALRAAALAGRRWACAQRRRGRAGAVHVVEEGRALAAAAAAAAAEAAAPCWARVGAEAGAEPQGLLARPAQVPARPWAWQALERLGAPLVARERAALQSPAAALVAEAAGVAAALRLHLVMRCAGHLGAGPAGQRRACAVQTPAPRREAVAGRGRPAVRRNRPARVGWLGHASFSQPCHLAQHESARAPPVRAGSCSPGPPLAAASHQPPACRRELCVPQARRFAQSYSHAPLPEHRPAPAPCAAPPLVEPGAPVPRARSAERPHAATTPPPHPAPQQRPWHGPARHRCHRQRAPPAASQGLLLLTTAGTESGTKSTAAAAQPRPMGLRKAALRSGAHACASSAGGAPLTWCSPARCASGCVCWLRGPPAFSAPPGSRFCRAGSSAAWHTWWEEQEEEHSGRQAQLRPLRPPSSMLSRRFAGLALPVPPGRCRTTAGGSPAPGPRPHLVHLRCNALQLGAERLPLLVALSPCPPAALQGRRRHGREQLRVVLCTRQGQQAQRSPTSPPLPCSLPPLQAAQRAGGPCCVHQLAARKAIGREQPASTPEASGG